MHPYLVSALGAFRLLLRDYEHLLEYVHPDHANMHVYSHRTYELLLRASTEFESISKGAAVERGIVKASDEPNIVHLSPLLHALDLSLVEVWALRWVPAPLVVQPLSGWDAVPHGLTWYRAYNSVKHNRALQFSEASLLNLTSGLAAYFLLLVGVRAIRVPMDDHVHLEDGRLEFTFPVQAFGIRVPGDWSIVQGG
jgi:hypothetical protein